MFWLCPRIHKWHGVVEAVAGIFRLSAQRQPASVGTGEWSTYQIFTAWWPDCSLKHMARIRSERDCRLNDWV